MITGCIDTGIFFCVIFKESGYEYCKKLLDDVYYNKIRGVISTIQLSELYTPFRRAGDFKSLERIKAELFKLNLKVRNVDEEVADLSSIYRSSVKTPDDKWLPLADSIILATAVAEEVDVLYTIDIDFYNVKDLKIMAPGMGLVEWVRKYGTKRQKQVLGLL